MRFSIVSVVAVIALLAMSFGASGIQAAATLRWCGQMKGIDVEVSAGHVTVSGSMSGFHRKSSDPAAAADRLTYHVALTSEDSPLATLLQNQDSRCVLASERPDVLRMAPDISAFTSVGSAPASQEHAISAHRMPTAGVKAGKNAFLVVKVTDGEGNAMLTKSAPLSLRGPAVSYDECSAPNICRLIALGIGGILDANFGEIPFADRIFNFVPGEPPIIPGDGYAPITQAGISIGVIVGSAILFALLIALICGRGEGSGAFAGGLAAGGIVAVEPAGVRTKLATDDQKTNVVRSFPATELNLDQRIEREPDDTPAGHTGRTDLSGVLNTKTPSGRDFTQV